MLRKIPPRGKIFCERNFIGKTGSPGKAKSRQGRIHLDRRRVFLDTKMGEGGPGRITG
jgi:hypothetical protein